MHTYRKILIFATVILVCNSSILIGQNLSKTNLQEDLNYLTDKLEEIHPNPFFKHGKEHFTKSIDSIYAIAESKNSITQIDLWKVLAPIITNLGDGHTELLLPKASIPDYYSNKKVIFSGEISIVNDRLLLVKDYSNTVEDKLPLEISSINGLSSITILNEMRRYVSAELESFRNSIIEIRFQRYFNVLFGSQSVFNVVFKEDKSNSLNAISRTKFLEERGKFKSEEDFYLKYKSDVPILTINSFEGSLGKFKKDLRKSFKDIMANQSENLIIDIRNNGGGDSRFGDALLRYISSSKYKQVDSIQIKSSKSAKKYLRKNFLGWKYYVAFPYLVFNRATNATFLKKNGKITSYTFKEKKGKGLYRGNVYLLTSPRTFSSANLFANAFKCYDVGKIVGESTGGVSIFYGDIIKIELPNSKIKCDISFKRFVTPCSINSMDGVQPDLKMGDDNTTEDDEILSTLINTIKNEKIKEILAPFSAGLTVLIL